MIFLFSINLAGLSPRLRELAQLYGVLALLPDPAAGESAVPAAA